MASPVGMTPVEELKAALAAHKKQMAAHIEAYKQTKDKLVKSCPMATIVVKGKPKRYPYHVVENMDPTDTEKYEGWFIKGTIKKLKAQLPAKREAIEAHRAAYAAWRAEVVPLREQDMAKLEELEAALAAAEAAEAGGLFVKVACAKLLELLPSPEDLADPDDMALLAWAIVHAAEAAMAELAEGDKAADEFFGRAWTPEELDEEEQDDEAAEAAWKHLPAEQDPKIKEMMDEWDEDADRAERAGWDVMDAPTWADIAAPA